MPKKRNSHNLQTFGGRLRYYRERKGLSQAEFARQIFVSRPLVAAWEKDERDSYTSHLEDICRALGVSEMTLITGFSEENQALSSEIGLSEISINVLRDLTRNSALHPHYKAGLNIDESENGKPATENIITPQETLEALNLLFETHNGWRLLSLIYRFCFSDFDHPTSNGQQVNAIEFQNRSSIPEGTTIINASLLRLATLKAIETELEDLRNNLIEMEDQTK